MKRITNIIISISVAILATLLIFEVTLENQKWASHWFLFIGTTLIISMWNYELIKRMFPKKTTAQIIKELRAETQYYHVIRSHGLFGDFSYKFFNKDPEWDKAIIVLAKNPQQAALRAYRRGYGRERGANFNRTTREWARWAVKPLDKPDNFRYISYFD